MNQDFQALGGRAWCKSKEPPVDRVTLAAGRHAPVAIARPRPPGGGFLQHLGCAEVQCLPRVSVISAVSFPN